MRAIAHGFAAAVVGLLPGCIVASGSLEISREGLGVDLAWLEVLVVAGTAADGAEVACGALDPDDDRLVVEYREAFDPDGDVVPPAIGHLPAGRHVFFVRGRDEACALVAVGCRAPEVRSGSELDVVVQLERVEPPVACPRERACLGGACRPCALDSECDDGDPCTVDDCEAGVCSGRPAIPDADGDGVGGVACGGTDCDDSDPLVYPGAPRRCGLARDHDCDSVLDDAQGCGTCAGATDLVRRPGATISSPAVALFVVGSPAGEPPDHELFVGAYGAIEVYRVPADGGAPQLTGSSRFPGAEPLRPSVLGEHTIVADLGVTGQFLYRTDDLRAGGATELARVGRELGTVSAFLAGTDQAFVSIGSGAGALATTSTSALPVLPEPQVAIAPGGWGNVYSLVRDVHPAGSWLFGAFGTGLTFAELDAAGQVVRSGRAGVAHGFGTDVTVSADWVFLAQGDKGLMAIPRSRVEQGSCCADTDLHYLPLPAGCSGLECQNAISVALAGPDRALVLTFTNFGEPKSSIYMLDVTDPTDAVVLARLPLSHPTATGRHLFVSGEVVYAAARVSAGDQGVVDVFDLTCP